jgi:hypothetical protein
MAAAILLGVALPTASTGAAEHHFALVFGSQSHPKQLRYSHTWVTFVKAVGEGPDLSAYQLYAHTVSWYPASKVVRVWTPFPEPGVNMTLEETLAAVAANRERVVLWGPFVIGPELWERSLRVKAILESGRVQYRAISGSRDLFVSDCIHAVAAVDPLFGRGHYPLIRVGLPASRFIAREVVIRSRENRGVDQADYDLRWLLGPLGLEGRGIEVVPARAIPHRSCVLCLSPP